MKRILSLILAVLLMFAVAPLSFAASDEAEDAANTLYALGLFQGKGANADGSPIFALDDTPTRHEAVTMLVRLLGKEQAALSGSWDIPFTDVVEWAKPYVGYAYANGLTNGVSAASFGGNATISASQYITFVLRALGYDSSIDFKWDAAWELSDTLGITDGRYNASSKHFLRGDVAIISANALDAKCKGSTESLMDRVRASTAPSVDFDDMLQAATAYHKDLFENPENFAGVYKYFVDNPDAATLLTDEEIETLLEPSYTMADSISYEEAVADTDLLFRTFRSAYGAYYYFGDEPFDKAHEEIMSWLDGQTTVNCEKFGETLGHAFTFLRDAHASVYKRYGEEQLRYEYFYCSGQNFTKDASGFYKYIDGEKWYFDSFTDERVSMEPGLSFSGEIVYSPVLFCTIPEMRGCSITLKNQEGKVKTQTINWTLSESYGPSFKSTDFRLLEENSITYISERSFNTTADPSELSAFVASGADVKDAKLIIFDIRSNGGGNSIYVNEWMKNFTGRTLSLGGIDASRYSPLYKAWSDKNGFNAVPSNAVMGTFDPKERVAKLCANNIPIIVLVDDTCGSSGESALNSLRNLKNTIVVGSNSAGYQICGNQMHFSLPNSHITFQFGGKLKFYFTPENIDFKGYTPDIWCNPQTALESVLNMVIRYDLANTDDVLSLRSELDGVVFNKREITLDFYTHNVPPGQYFGTSSDTSTAYVRINGKLSDDFTLICNNTADFSVTKAEGGMIKIESKTPGNYSFIIQSGKTESRFFFHAS